MAGELGRLLFLVDGDDDIDELLAAIRTAAPPSSLVGVVAGGAVRTTPVDRAKREDGSDWTVRGASDLDDLRALLDDAPGADAVHVIPPQVLSPELLRRLASAATRDTACATVSVTSSRDAQSSRTTNGGIPDPAIPAPQWGVVFIRRDAIEVAVGNARASAGSDRPPSGTVRELLQHALTAPGFVHRCIAPETPNGASEHGRNGAEGRRSPTSTLRITIDARSLGGPVSGTQVQLMSLMNALVETNEAEITALVPPRIDESVEYLVEPLQEGVRFSSDASEEADVFHRPNQLASRLELLECMRYGRRFVLTHQDMILDRTPAFFYSAEIWSEFRRTTHASIAAADHVAFFSKHAALDAASDGVLDPDRATVVPLGVDHVDTGGAAELPTQVAALGARPFVVMLGTSLAHKNRVFAIRALRELVERSWDGALVLAGGDFPWGSSRRDERAALDRDPRIRNHVVDLGQVSESEKRALYREADLVLFPSLYEGFGLIPFEAAAFGTPCLYAWRGPVCEFLPSSGALPSDFSASATASRVLEILASPRLASELVSDVRSAAANLTWKRTAEGYLEVYRRAVAAHPRPLDRLILDGMQLTDKEQQLIHIYRYRRGFATAIDRLMAAGAAAMRSRVGRRWDSRQRRKRDR